VLASQAYGYDGNGNVTSQAAGGLLPSTQVTYTYDEASRLVSSVSGTTTTSYGYDGDGNLTQDGPATSSYNGQDQVTSSTSSSGTTAYSYDLDGSLASQSGPGGTTAFTSDAFGQMITAGGETDGYDALGRLVTSATSSATTPVAYAGTGQQVASDGTGAYAYGPSGSQTSAKAAGGAGYQVLADQHGDITATFSPSATASTLAGWATYTPWGTATVNGAMPQAGYQGDYTDATTGLVHMGARWYNPSTGSFTTADTIAGSPLSSTVDGNPYAYTSGNPLSETDPTGHLCQADDISCYVVAVGAAGGAAAAPEIIAAAAPWAAAFAVGFGIGYGIGSAINYFDSPSPGSIPGSTFQQIASAVAGGYDPESSWNPAPATCTTGCGVNYNFGTGSSGSPGGGTGAGACTPITCPPTPPPPPPPPPQNPYAAGLAFPTSPPGSLTNTPLITKIMQGLSSIASLFAHGHGMTEKVPGHNEAPDGTQPKVRVNPANQDKNSPQPATAGGSAGAASGNGGGSCAEQGPVEAMLYGGRPGEGLPGSEGVPIEGRPSITDLENLTVKYGVEFAVTYRLGSGPGGAGGQYFLYSGDISSVRVPTAADSMLIYHTHPRGTQYPSAADRNLLGLLGDLGSPQRVSCIIPVGTGRAVPFRGSE
jgi:RHS repeat-associated protein